MITKAREIVLWMDRGQWHGTKLMMITKAKDIVSYLMDGSRALVCDEIDNDH